MSCRNYRVTFAGRDEGNKVREYVRNSVLENQISEERRRLLSRLDWQPIGLSDYDLPDAFSECNLINQRVEDSKGEDRSILVSFDNQGLSLTFTDCNFPDEKCEEVAAKFARRVYKKVTGKEISEDKISVKPVARVKSPICSFCLEATAGFSFTCPVCRKSFCYDHRRPETHGCPVEKNIRNSAELKNAKSRVSKKKADTRIFIHQIPCG